MSTSMNDGLVYNTSRLCEIPIVFRRAVARPMQATVQ